MYKKLSTGVECRVKWAATNTPYFEINGERYYFNKRDFIAFSDMLNIFVANYWDDFSPGRINYTDDFSDDSEGAIMHENRIKHLEEGHKVLDKKIHGLEATGVYEDENLHSMKKQKLLLKDEIESLRRKQKENEAKKNNES